MPVGAMPAARRRIPTVIPHGQIPAGLRNANVMSWCVRYLPSCSWLLSSRGIVTSRS